MILTKTERLELSALSKAAFGRLNYWQKLLNQGATVLAKDGLGNDITPKAVGRKGRQVRYTTTKWFNNIDDLRTYMSEIVAKKHALLEEMKAAQKQGIQTEAK